MCIRDSYHEALVHPVMLYGKEPENILLLGGGDGLATREILRHASVKQIDLVDLDPEMTWLGTEYAPLVRLNQDALANDKVTIHNMDAFLYVRDTDKIYDRVIIDFPDPHNEALSKLYSSEFYAMLSRVVAEDGVIISQSSSPFFAHRAYWTIGRTMDVIFQDRESFHITVPSFGQWGFHIAHKGKRAPMRPFPDELVSLSEPIFNAAKTFPKDIVEPKDLKPNSIFEPILYHIYNEDLKSPGKKVSDNGT